MNSPEQVLGVSVSLEGPFRVNVLSKIHKFVNLIPPCEMKFSVNEFIIDKEYDMRLRNEVETF